MISIQATFRHNIWHYSAYCTRKLEYVFNTFSSRQPDLFPKENTLLFDLQKRPLNVGILDFHILEVRLRDFTKKHFMHIIISILSLV